MVSRSQGQFPRLSPVSGLEVFAGTGGQAVVQLKGIEHGLHPGPGPA